LGWRNKLETDILQQHSIITDPKKKYTVLFPNGIDPVTTETDNITRKAKDVLSEIKEHRDHNHIVDALGYSKLQLLYDQELKEYQDDEVDLTKKVKIVAGWLKQAKHTVVYTGAGISTSAKIPDYRGPQGAWTMHERGGFSQGLELGQAFPTYAHYALTELLRKDKLKYIVSTNLDGLHRRSGTTADQISELHGNCYREVCSKCNKEYLRSFDTNTPMDQTWTHLTGRNCDDCKGPLKDTIIHFTENMPPVEMGLAIKHARNSDLGIVMGTSMCVQPAASLPEKVLKNPNGKLVIVNLQVTPYDDVASLRIYAKTDKFMELLMKELELEKFDLKYDSVAYLKALEKKK